MPRTLPRTFPLAELHCHLGAAVTPAIMWGIAHAQGIKLPTKDYWEFRDLITVPSKGSKSFDGYLPGRRLQAPVPASPPVRARNHLPHRRGGAGRGGRARRGAA